MPREQTKFIHYRFNQGNIRSNLPHYLVCVQFMKFKLDIINTYISHILLIFFFWLCVDFMASAKLPEQDIRTHLTFLVIGSSSTRISSDFCGLALNLLAFIIVSMKSFQFKPSNLRLFQMQSNRFSKIHQFFRLFLNPGPGKIKQNCNIINICLYLSYCS